MMKNVSRLTKAVATLVIVIASCGGSTTSNETSEGGAKGGGAGSTGGGAGSAGGGAGGGGGNETCQKAIVTFQMIPWHPEGGAPADYCAGMACGGQWLTIKSATGEELDRSSPCGVSCNDCAPRTCLPLACMLPEHLKAEGATQTWDGTYFASSTCEGAKQCSQSTCVAAGSHWIATMCAYPSVGPDGGFGCMGGNTPNCVDVPFDYPAAGPVVGTINPTR